MSENKIVITKTDLEKAEVQEKVETQRNIRRIAADYEQKISTGTVVGKLNRNSNDVWNGVSAKSDIVSYLVGGLLAGLVGWAVQEALTPTRTTGNVYTSTMMFTATIGVFLGLGLGAMDGILEKSSQKALKGGAIGIVIGIFGGGIAGLMGQYVYILLLSTGSKDLQTYMFARTIAWGIVGLIIGIVPGVSIQAWKKIRNGLLGGLIGGALGGALFDPIGLLIDSGNVSRLVGICIIGGGIGILISLAEEMFKEAWLLVESGPLKGKQFILYKNPTRIGSSQECEIYLFKDTSILPIHVSLHVDGKNNSISIQDSQAILRINGQQLNNSKLTNNDIIEVGHYSFRYCEK